MKKMLKYLHISADTITREKKKFSTQKASQRLKAGH